MRILVTGATGNVGGAVLRSLSGSGADLFAAGTSARPPAGLEAWPWRQLDLASGAGLGLGERFDALFLMRPPQMTDPAPFQALLKGVSRPTRVVFLSVQGAGERAWLPHAKIEKLIEASGLEHHFVRAGYFMENLTTTLADEIRRNRRIYLPSGSLAFNWTAVDDIAAVAAKLLLNGGPRVLELTGPQACGFAQAVATLNKAAGLDLRYVSPSLPAFVAGRRRAGDPWAYILVQLLLHWLPRFTGQDPLTSDFRAFMGRDPIALEDWAASHRDQLRAL